MPLHSKATSTSSSPLSQFDVAPQIAATKCPSTSSKWLRRRSSPQSAAATPSAAVPTRGPAGPRNEATDGQGTTRGKQWSVCSHRVDGWGSRAHPNRSLPCQPAGTLGQHRAPQHSARKATTSGTTLRGPCSTSTTCPQRVSQQAVPPFLLLFYPSYGTAQAHHTPLHLPLGRDLRSSLLQSVPPPLPTGG